MRQRPQVSCYRLAYLGWIFINLCCRTHCRVSLIYIITYLDNPLMFTLCSIGVTIRDRPAAAPQTGPYELGYYAIAHPTFIAGMTASATIFVSSAGTSAFLPVIAEMRNPKDYNKALFLCMGIVNAAYLTFSLVVYRWCGQWVASPSLGVSVHSHSHASKHSNKKMNRVRARPSRW
jgi:hypothetical protein